MPLTTTTKKYLRYTATTFLFTGVVAVTGFLSFAGMLALNGSIYLAMAGFILGGGIEGEIYAQYINKSLLKLFSDKYLEEQIYNKLLKELIAKYPENEFLQDYSQLLEHLAELKEEQNEAHEGDFQKKLKEELENAERSLKWMKRDFAKFMKNRADNDFLKLNDVIKADKKNDIAKEIADKKSWIRLSWILNIGAGLSCFLVGLEAAQISILALSSYFSFAISGAALSASVFGIAIVGALGYTFLIHHTISQIIQDDTFGTWKKDILNLQKPRNFTEALKYAGIAFVISLSILATLATAGTWWYAAKAGAKMISWLAKFANPIRIAAVFTMGLTSLAFNLTRSLASLKALGGRLAEFSEHISEKTEEIHQRIKIHLDHENLAQLVNPFRIINILINIPFKVVAFTGHLISMAVMGDRIAGIPAIIAAVINFFNEFFVDQDLIFPHHHHHKKHSCQQHHEHETEQESKLDSNHHEHDHHIHKHEHEEHDHSHIDLIGKFLKYVLLGPSYLLEACWDWGFSKINQTDNPPLSFKQAHKKAFHGLPPAPPQPSTFHLSDATLLRERENRIRKAKEKQKDELQYAPENEIAIINDLNTQILNKNKVASLTYMDADGTINSAAFFSANDKMSRVAKKICEKSIKIANDGPQYNIAPGV